MDCIANHEEGDICIRIWACKMCNKKWEGFALELLPKKTLEEYINNLEQELEQHKKTHILEQTDGSVSTL